VVKRMANDDQAEDRLRQLLRDDRWSLPAWPDAEARVRKAARRQRMTAAAAGAIAVAAAAAAILVPLTLLATAPSKTPAITGPGPTAPHSAPPRRHYTMPPVGAPGFPAALYPAPRPHPVVNSIGHCPAPEGLQPFAATSAAAARGVIPKLGHSFRDDLRLTDRTFWPVIASGWQASNRVFTPARPRPILYSGPLESYHSSQGPPDFTRLISVGCGTRLARDTWMIVDGPRTSPALQSEWLLLTRHGHMLLYYAQ
jgi:hypothetical protein